MKFTLLGNVYEDKGDEGIRSRLQKISKWIQEAGLRGKRNWHKILSEQYGGYLVEAGSGSTLLESQCENCDTGGCQTCYIQKNEGEKMTNLNLRINEAFGPYKRPQVKTQTGFAMVHQIDRNGELRQTKRSRIDEAAYWQDQRKEQSIEESGLSLDDKILAAFK